MPSRILCVSGSTSSDSRTRKLLDIAADGARQAGAEIKVLDLRDVRLPIMVADDKAQALLPDVVNVRTGAAEADGFLLATPEYHGGLSGALKNWFDFLYEELSGKVAGVLSMTGGGGGDMSITAAKNSFNWCHGFTLPFHVSAKSADFDGENVVNDKVKDRLVRLGRDVVRYAMAIRPAWEEARRKGRVAEAGFAGFHSGQ